MDDDFNTPKAVAVLFEMVKEINTMYTDGEGVMSESLQQYILLLEKLGRVLGLFENVTEKLKTAHVGDEVEQLIQERQQARQEKNWGRADEIRNLLTGKGIVLEDTPQGVRWKKM